MEISLKKNGGIPIVELIKCMNDKIYSSGFFDFWLIFCLDGALAVVAPFDFNLDGFTLYCGGGDIFYWTDLLTLAKYIDMGFAFVYDPAGDWYALGLASG